MALNPRLIRKGEDSRKTWNQLNALLKRAEILEGIVRQHEAAVVELRAKSNFRDRIVPNDARWS